MAKGFRCSLMERWRSFLYIPDPPLEVVVVVAVIAATVVVIVVVRLLLLLLLMINLYSGIDLEEHYTCLHSMPIFCLTTPKRRSIFIIIEYYIGVESRSEGLRIVSSELLSNTILSSLRLHSSGVSIFGINSLVISDT